MTRDEIEPAVPVMPRDDSTETIRADGGHREHLDRDDVAAPLVPDLR